MPTAVASPWPSGPVVVSTPGGLEILGMARRPGAELAEIPDLVERHLRVAGEIEQRIEQHRAVAGRQHEAVAVRPFRIGRVVFQELREQDGCDIGCAHRQAGMAGLRLLHGVHGEATDRIGHTGVVDLRHDENPPEMRSLMTIRGARESAGFVAGDGKEVGGWIASRFPESKARKHGFGRKTCLAVHSFQAALRGPISPRKLLLLSACRTGSFTGWPALKSACCEP